MKHFKSVEELKEALKSVLGTNVYQSFKKQVEARYSHIEEGFDFYLQNRIDGNGNCWTEDAVYCAFSWIDSKEGLEYWSSINRKWQNYLNEED